MNSLSKDGSHRLVNLAGLSDEMQIQARRADDRAWIDVIHRMDEIYSDLVKYQVELEEKNSELENAQLFIQSVVSSMSEILIVCNINGDIQQVNKALEENVGFVEKSLIGKPLTFLFSKSSLPAISKFSEYIHSSTIIEREVELLDKQKRKLPMIVNCSARYDHKNNLSGLVVTGRPIEELRKAYKALKSTHSKLKETQTQLVQSEKMASIGRLVAGVAHELNNPISFLYANMFCLKEYQNRITTYIGAIHGDQTKKELDILRNQLNIDDLLNDIEPLVEGSLDGASRVKEIVKNLQNFTTPQQEISKNFELIEVIKRAASWVKQATPMAIQFSENFPDKLIINNKEGYIHQILINLVQNAIDALKETKAPKIEISVEQFERQVLIKVKDNGQGLLEENVVKIFDPFFTTKPAGSGTGLGLYISYQLAKEQCSGKLSVKNLKNNGVEFLLTLPFEVKL